jgi:hypothetical protein
MTARLVVAVTLTLTLTIPTVASAQTTGNTKHDRLWDGMLIGGGVGAIVGTVAGRKLCGTPPEPDCAALMIPAGFIYGIALGALVDGLHHPAPRPGVVTTGFRPARSVTFRFRF